MRFLRVTFSLDLSPMNTRAFDQRRASVQTPPERGAERRSADVSVDPGIGFRFTSVCGRRVALFTGWAIRNSEFGQTLSLLSADPR